MTIALNSKNYSAHQVLFAAMHGRHILEDCTKQAEDPYLMSHLCHKKWCCKPSHLARETYAANTAREACKKVNRCVLDVLIDEDLPELFLHEPPRCCFFVSPFTDVELQNLCKLKRAPMTAAARLIERGFNDGPTLMKFEAEQAEAAAKYKRPGRSGVKGYSLAIPPRTPVTPPNPNTVSEFFGVDIRPFSVADKNRADRILEYHANSQGSYQPRERKCKRKLNFTEEDESADDDDGDAPQVTSDTELKILLDKMIMELKQLYQR